MPRRGFDYNWALDKGITCEPQLITRAEHPVPGRAMAALSTEPVLQM